MNTDKKAAPGITNKYNITRLVWFEIYDEHMPPFLVKKELKKWKRSWKIGLVEAKNPARSI